MDDELNNGNGGGGVQTGDVTPGGAPPRGVPPVITPEAMQIQMQTMQQLMNQQMELFRLQMQINPVVAQLWKGKSTFLKELVTFSLNCFLSLLIGTFLS